MKAPTLGHVTTCRYCRQPIDLVACGGRPYWVHLGPAGAFPCRERLTGMCLPTHAAPLPGRPAPARTSVATRVTGGEQPAIGRVPVTPTPPAYAASSRRRWVPAAPPVPAGPRPAPTRPPESAQHRRSTADATNRSARRYHRLGRPSPLPTLLAMLLHRRRPTRARTRRRLTAALTPRPS